LGYDVRMHPDNPDKMYVTDAFAGVFISDDAGKTWYPSNQGLTDRTGESQNAIPVFCLTIDPHNPDIIWTGTQFSGAADYLNRKMAEKAGIKKHPEYPIRMD